MSDSWVAPYAQVLTLLNQMSATLDREYLQSLQTLHGEVQGVMQADILTVDVDGQTEINPAQLQSIHTEMNRDLRLLNTDLMFLSAAKHQGTVDQRIEQIGDRLNRLIEFCEFVVNQCHSSDSNQPS
jgi:hypothetical protein